VLRIEDDSGEKDCPLAAKQAERETVLLTLAV
jgi:hypothetical protein